MFVNEYCLILVTASHLLYFYKRDDLDWCFEIPAIAMRYLALNASLTPNFLILFLKLFF